MQLNLQMGPDVIVSNLISKLLWIKASDMHKSNVKLLAPDTPEAFSN